MIMKRFLLLCVVALGARAARAQNNTNLRVYYIHEIQFQPPVQSVLELKYTDLKVLGTWSYEDETGFHGYIYVDPAQEAKWENSDLVMTLDANSFDIQRTKRWKNGEMALILDGLGATTAAGLRAEKFAEPLEDQIEVQWQPLDSTNPMDGTKDLNITKFRVTLTNTGDQTLRLAPGSWSESHNSQVSFEIIRDGQKLAITPDNATGAMPDAAPDENITADLKPLNAGESWQQIVDLSQIADFSRAGDYEVKATYQLPIRSGGTPDEPVVKNLEFHREFEFYLTRK